MRLKSLFVTANDDVRVSLCQRPLSHTQSTLTSSDGACDPTSRHTARDGCVALQRTAAPPAHSVGHNLQTKPVETVERQRGVSTVLVNVVLSCAGWREQSPACACPEPRLDPLIVQDGVVLPVA